MQTSQIACELQMSGAGAAVTARSSRSSNVSIARIIEQSLAPALIRFGASVMTTLRGLGRRDDVFASRYEGCSWGDTTEREMTNDIVNWGCTRF